ncbi:MAG: RNA polymerase sigma factor [Clostridia bacterium]|nr:RNA polymerase sigma factor [Clostridia bacterium]
MSDGEIVELLEARDEHALELIDRQYGSKLKGIIRGIVKDEGETDECLNDVYLRIWNAIPPAKPADLGSYLCTAARNTAIDRYETQHRKRDIPESALVAIDGDRGVDPEAPGRVDETVEQAAESERIRALMIEYTKTLPLADRRICIARFYYGAKHREIAARLGIPVGTVKSALHRIKKGMAAFLKKEGIGL